MRDQRWSLSIVTLALTAVSSLLCGETTAAGIGILPSVVSSRGDSAHEGASEFEVLLHVALLQRTHRVTGLVSIGDRHGMRPHGGERALTRAAASGVTVVKLAPRGVVAPAPDGLFLDGGALTAEQASEVLARLIELHGAPPAAVDPARPTPRELTAIRAHLGPFQIALATAAVQQRAELVTLRK
jgi:hypothetical protein